MKQIIVMPEFYTAKHLINVYDNSNKIDALRATTEDLPKAILKMCKEYDITDVKISGAAIYAKAFARKIREYEMKEYKENKIKIYTLGGSSKYELLN